jgi:protein-disulfide isomerase
MPAATEERAEGPAQIPLPRRGRLWVIAALVLGAGLLGYAIVSLATQKPGRAVVHVAGIADAQEIFGGVPQAGDRLGSSDAPVSIQVFNDIQCSNCRDDFLGILPRLVEGPVREGEVKLLYRHYSVSESPQELGFYGAEAAAAQGYGWQYSYLFERNQEEARRFGVDEDFLDSIAGGVEELNEPEWREYLEREGGHGGSIDQRLTAYEELGTKLGIRARTAAIVTGPNGTQTLQDGPSPAQIERAIEEVR